MTQACVGKQQCKFAFEAANLPALNLSASCGSGPPQLAVIANGCTPAPPANDWIFDLGVNMAGVATLRLPSGVAAGTAIKLRYAEVLKADGDVDMAWGGENLQATPGQGNCANQTDEYITHGGPETETYTPFFTYHGYRYVKVEGLPASITPTAGMITGHFLHSNVSVAGSVHFKKPELSILNGIQKAIKYTQLSNYYHHPTVRAPKLTFVSLRQCK